MRIDGRLLGAIDDSTAEPAMTITALTRELNTTPRALRFYEEKGLLIPQRQRGRRTYAPSDQARARLIVELRAIDIAVTDIESILRELLSAPADQRPGILKGIVDEQIDRLRETQARVVTMLAEAKEVREVLENVA